MNFEMVEVLGYVADVSVLGTYALRRWRTYDWANALGAIPFAAIEVEAHAWPVLPLTVGFGLIGWWHLFVRISAHQTAERVSSVVPE